MECVEGILGLDEASAARGHVNEQEVERRVASELDAINRAKAKPRKLKSVAGEDFSWEDAMRLAPPDVQGLILEKDKAIHML